jgi:hypothetical protein
MHLNKLLPSLGTTCLINPIDSNNSSIFGVWVLLDLLLFLMESVNILKPIPKKNTQKFKKKTFKKILNALKM